VLVRFGDLRGRRVLEIGCGTGTLAAALVEQASAKVWATDPSAEMLDVARRRVPAGVGLKQARAEALPFRDGWFERAVGRAVVHLLDRPRAFAELRRVLATDGRLVLATFAPAHFDEFWLNRYFPSIESIDRARFPEPETLRRELLQAGFADVAVERLGQGTTLDRETALARIRGRHISTFDLLEEDEITAGTARAERELPESVDVRLEWAIVVAARSRQSVRVAQSA
jgi:ubiquinone/menaquinone biosynthesis C-methylase UbiE